MDCATAVKQEPYLEQRKSFDLAIVEDSLSWTAPGMQNFVAIDSGVSAPSAKYVILPCL